MVDYKIHHTRNFLYFLVFFETKQKKIEMELTDKNEKLHFI